MLEYCSASHDLRLRLCDDFKDYPRHGKFTETAKLKDSMSKAVSPCNSFDITFISFPEPCGTNLAQESIQYTRISCMATSCAAWMLRNPLLASHIAEHFSLSTQPRSHTWVWWRSFHQWHVAFGKSRNLFNKLSPFECNDILTRIFVDLFVFSVIFGRENYSKLNFQKTTFLFSLELPMRRSS